MEQDIVSINEWRTEAPDEDCFALVMTREFPKNCFFVVAEWDNDAKAFYSESTYSALLYWDCWTKIQPNKLLQNDKYNDLLKTLTSKDPKSLPMPKSKFLEIMDETYNEQAPVLSNEEKAKLAQFMAGVMLKM
jgi:hypothetical protein